MSQEQNKTISGSVYDVYTTNSQEYRENRMPRVGQTVEFEDGRKFVFCSSETDVTRGLMHQARQAVNCAAFGAWPRGSTEIVVTEPGVTVNEWRGGMLLDAAAGCVYKIKGNSESSVTGSVTVRLYDGLTQDMGDVSNLSVKPPRHENVELGGASGDYIGIPLVDAPLNGADKCFFWAQYQGVSFIISISGTPGSAVTGASGGTLDDAVAGDVIVGVIEAIAASGTYNQVYLMIDGGC